MRKYYCDFCSRETPPIGNYLRYVWVCHEGVETRIPIGFGKRPKLSKWGSLDYSCDGSFDICQDCAADLYIDFGEQLKRGDIKLARRYIDPNKHF